MTTDTDGDATGGCHRCSDGSQAKLVRVADLLESDEEYEIQRLCGSCYLRRQHLPRYHVVLVEDIQADSGEGVVTDGGTKYGDQIPEDHWEEEEDDSPPAWKEDTTASIDITVALHEQGYQEDDQWRVHCLDRTDDDAGVVAAYAIRNRNKGNYWRDGQFPDDAIRFRELPFRVRRRVAAVLGTSSIAEITMDVPLALPEEGQTDDC